MAAVAGCSSCQAVMASGASSSIWMVGAWRRAMPLGEVAAFGHGPFVVGLDDCGDEA